MPLLPARREERAPARWDPFRELEDVRQQVDRVMEQLMGSSSLTAEVAWSPLVDVEETDDAWIVEAEVPGAKRDDITIELDGGELAIHGEIKERERVGILRRRTRRTGQFEYRTILPRDVEADRITAELADGILTVNLPKSEAAKPRRVEITAR